MNLTYPAQFIPEEEGGFSVRIPGIDGTPDGAYTCGDDIDDARRMASDLVDCWLSIHLQDNTPIPVPGDFPGGDGWELVRPSLRMQFVVTVRALRQREKLSQAEMANRLGVKQPVYARLEDPDKANPTLKTINNVFAALGHPAELIAR